MANNSVDENEKMLDDYDTFLDTFDSKSHSGLKHATLEKNLFDPVIQDRLLNDFSDGSVLERTAYKPGYKDMTATEIRLRKYEFFVEKQGEWVRHFVDYLNSHIPSKKIEAFMNAFATSWVDGMARRQDSDEMMGIKASIRDHDHVFHADASLAYVINKEIKPVRPLLEPDEMKAVFRANEALIESLIPEYLTAMEGDRHGSINWLFVHRGLNLRKPLTSPLRELNYLSSYSLALTPVENFAQTWSSKTGEKGIPAILSARLPAIQHRTVAFAPFISRMPLTQLELVVAPPISSTELTYNKVHGGISDYTYE